MRMRHNMMRLSLLRNLISLFAMQAELNHVVANFTFGTNGAQFKCNPDGSLWCAGDAAATSDFLILTPIDGSDILNSTYNLSTYGLAVSNEPFPLQRSFSDPDLTSTSFRTTFRFTIAPSDPAVRGDGMAFVLFSEAQPRGSLENSFGVYKSSGEQVLRTLTVEFDTYQNSDSGDIDGNHVGVDLGNDTSEVARSASDVGIDLAANQTVYTWIQYDSSTQTLEVRISSNKTKPAEAFLHYALNIFDVFPPDSSVYLGFSASNGYCDCPNVYNVLEWVFESFAFDPHPGGGGGQAQVELIAGLTTAALSLVSVFLLCVLCIRIRKKKLKYEVENVETPELDGLADNLRFSYKQLSLATAQFQEDYKLGQGGFGSVYRGKMPRTGQLVAVKRVSHDSSQGVREFVAEVSIISQLRHRNIVRLLGWCNDKGKFLLVYELMPNGSLGKALFHPANPASVLSWEVRFTIIAGAAEALLYLHEGWRQQVIHRDFKSSNIMLDEDFNAMLGDFGLARMVDRRQNPATTLVAGTYGYIAPEAPASGKFTEKTDVFAFGAVALEVGCGRSAYCAQEPEEILVDWVWGNLDHDTLFAVVDPRLEGDYDEKQMEVLLLLGLLCSHPNPDDRPTMRQVVEILRGNIALPPVPSKKPRAHYDRDGRHLLVEALTSPLSTSSSKAPADKIGSLIVFSPSSTESSTSAMASDPASKWVVHVR
ncbi:hypothetical protein Mapa_000795 [Marchantia paleacea]|nr:hypothetical protein Mapa_000795 [Marchantia paleacea]